MTLPIRAKPSVCLPDAKCSSLYITCFDLFEVWAHVTGIECDGRKETRGEPEEGPFARSSVVCQPPLFTHAATKIPVGDDTNCSCAPSYALYFSANTCDEGAWYWDCIRGALNCVFCAFQRIPLRHCGREIAPKLSICIVCDCMEGRTGGDAISLRRAGSGTPSGEARCLLDTSPRQTILLSPFLVA